MLGAAIVPDRNAVYLPFESTGVLWGSAVLVKEFQYCLTLRCTHTLDVRREQAVDKDYLFTCFGVGANDRVSHGRIGCHGIGQAFPAPWLGEAFAKTMRKVMIYACS